MRKEREKMLAGELYQPLDEELVRDRRRARLLFQALNRTTEDEKPTRERLLRELIPNAGRNLRIEPPFFCDYGTNISLGDEVFFNFNCVILDAARVRIGSRVLCAPGVQILAATHPVSTEQRRTGLELGKPVDVADDVWIGAGAILCPGVRVGARSVIGAGSVVTEDIPEGVVAVGNPCRVVRRAET